MSPRKATCGLRAAGWPSIASITVVTKRSRALASGQGRGVGRQVAVERDGHDTAPAQISLESRRHLRLLDADLTAVHGELAIGEVPEDEPVQRPPPHLGACAGAREAKLMSEVQRPVQAADRPDKGDARQGPSDRLGCGQEPIADLHHPARREQARASRISAPASVRRHTDERKPGTARQRIDQRWQVSLASRPRRHAGVRLQPQAGAAVAQQARAAGSTSLG